MDLHMEAPTRTILGGSLASTEEVNSLQKRKRARLKKQGKAFQNKDKGPDFLLDCSSLKTNASVKDPLHESPTLPNLLSSQRIIELNSKKKKKRKRLRTKHKAMEINVKNDYCTPNDIFSSKLSTPALDMPSEHPTQFVSTNPIMIQSCLERDIRLGENEEKEQSMLKTAVENSNRECDFEEVRCTINSVIANAEGFAKDSGLEVVKLNVEQGINDNTCNPVDGTEANAREENARDRVWQSRMCIISSLARSIRDVQVFENLDAVDDIITVAEAGYDDQFVLSTRQHGRGSGRAGRRGSRGRRSG